MLQIIFDIVFSFLLSTIIAIPVYRFLCKLKFGQPILEYVDNHQGKQGTPTMGGIIFLISFIISNAILIDGFVKIIYLCLLFVLLNSLIGMYDDFLKIKGKKNLGLKPWQKLFFQLLVTAGFGVCLYLNDITYIIIPFSHKVINLGFWMVPIVIILSIFYINSTNLTDGLDGLVSLITAIVLCLFMAILGLILQSTIFENVKIENFSQNFVEFLGIFLGAILGFLFYNCYPAKMFMGDTGSLSIGALIMSVAFSTGTVIYAFAFGIMFVVSSVSVIIQVAYYKLTKKRVFLMAPLHHHFELKGVHENRITVGYGLVTIFVSLLIILIELVCL